MSAYGRRGMKISQQAYGRFGTGQVETEVRTQMNQAAGFWGWDRRRQTGCMAMQNVFDVVTYAGLLLAVLGAPGP